MSRIRALATLFMALVAFSFNPAFADDPAPADPVAEEVEAPAPADPVAEEAEEADAPEAGAPEAGAEEADAPEAGAEEASEEAESAVPETDAEALAVAVSLIDALKAGQYPLAAGLFLTLLVYLVNRFSAKDLIPDKYEPLLAFGVGFAGSAGTALALAHPVGEALIEGAMAGLVAVGGWQVALQYLMPAKKQVPAPSEEPPAEA